MREMNQDPFKTWAAVAWYSTSPSYATLFGHILIFFLMDGCRSLEMEMMPNLLVMVLNWNRGLEFLMLSLPACQ
jgi:hypothetical protein